MLVLQGFDDRVVDCLMAGGLVVLRTDTLYGVVAKADNQAAVDRLYGLKRRDDDKASIVLIADESQLFDRPDAVHRDIMRDSWPGPVSIILPSSSAPTWVTRGTESVAYRLPDDDDLRGLILKTGPLIAPSANPQGQLPAMSIEVAIDYFEDQVDIYIDGGTVEGAKPSQLLRLGESGQVERLR